jgi:hypothetical protein
LFFTSAVIGGMSVVILESLISARVYKRKAEMNILPAFSKGLGIALLVYFAMKVTDLYARGATVWVWDKPHFFFFLELFGTVALPALLRLFGVRNRRTLLGCGLGLRGGAEPLQRQPHQLRRLPADQLPSFIEIIITIGAWVSLFLTWAGNTAHLQVGAD